MAKKTVNKVKRRASLSASENKKKEQHTVNVETQRPKNPFYRRSVLIPQAERWQEDLPVQWLEHDVEPNAIWLNEKNDIWLEIPRYENQISWDWGNIFSFISVLFMIYFLLVPFIFYGMDGATLVAIIAFLFFLSLFKLMVRMTYHTPRGTPVRLNRKRQKVYIYEHHRSSWNPWIDWPVEIRVFNWDDVRGEITYEAGRSHQGYQLHGAVCQPGTSHVRERFALTWTVGDKEALRELWCYCCHYMQHRPVPETARFAEHPQQWGHIHWPEALDVESRTAPNNDSTAGV